MGSADGHPHHGVDYVEFQVKDLAQARAFFGRAFGWTFTDYGPEYVGLSREGREFGGMRVGTPGAQGPLVILFSNALEATRDAVVAAGGTLTRDIYAFPGGRRFEFTDPGGNALAAWSDR